MEGSVMQQDSRPIVFSPASDNATTLGSSQVSHDYDKLLHTNGVDECTPGSLFSTRTHDDYCVLGEVEKVYTAVNLTDLNIVLTPLQTSIAQMREILEVLGLVVRHCSLLWTQATTDGLTGLSNSAATIAQLKQKLACAHLTGTPLSICKLDLDHFKAVNDSWRDHEIGNEVLREIACRMQNILRVYDQAGIGREGGDEFLITLPGCSAADAHLVAERIRECIEGEPVYTSNGAFIPVTASVGIATYDGYGEPEVRALCAIAEKHLYQAKANGKNRVEPMVTV
jgi:diguanylate cyclase (GGDEF)-like protein